MHQRTRRIRSAAALVGLLALLPLAACTSIPGPVKDSVRAVVDRFATPEPEPKRAEVVVASFNFPESTLVAEIYAQALAAAGVPVRRELDVGPRELAQPALFEGLIDVIPEYAGAALASLDPAAPVSLSDPAAVHAELGWELSARALDVLDAAPAQNQNGVVVARETADHFQLHKVSDLVSLAPSFSIGGRPECPARAYCLAGLERQYGLHFQRFVAVEDDAERAQALRDHTIDAAVLFTTDAALASSDLVLLEDDRHLQPAENIVPVVSARAMERYRDQLTKTLDAVSSQLTTGTLAFLNWRIALAGKTPAGEAHGWLVRHQLVPR